MELLVRNRETLSAAICPLLPAAVLLSIFWLLDVPLIYAIPALLILCPVLCLLDAYFAKRMHEKALKAIDSDY